MFLSLALSIAISSLFLIGSAAFGDPIEVSGDVNTPEFFSNYNQYFDFDAGFGPFEGPWQGYRIYFIQRTPPGLPAKYISDMHSEILIVTPEGTFRSEYRTAPGPTGESDHYLEHSYRSFNGTVERRLVAVVELTPAQARELAYRLQTLGAQRSPGYSFPNETTPERVLSGTLKNTKDLYNCHQYSARVHQLAEAIRQPHRTRWIEGVDYSLRRGTALAGGRRGLAIGGGFGVVKGAFDDVGLGPTGQLVFLGGGGAYIAYHAGGGAGLARFSAVAVPTIATGYVVKVAGGTDGMSELSGIYAGMGAGAAMYGPGGAIAVGGQAIVFKLGEGIYWIGRGFYSGGLSNVTSLMEEGYNPVRYYFGGQ